LKTETFLVGGLLLALALPAAAQQSLIDPDAFRAPAADQRAYRVGDILTVNVQETTRARSGAATDAASDTGIRVGLESPSTDYDASFGISGNTGAGAETSRIGELRAQISVRVVDVLAGGVMAIRGEQELVVNGERQRISLSGLVRPEDVTAANTVWSHRIADASVELTGIGTVSESQRQSVVYRVLKWLRLM
jgi:flagellar L-ring protein precursor FlgH